MGFVAWLSTFLEVQALEDRQLSYILGNMCRFFVALVSLGVELQSMVRGNISDTRVHGVGTIVPEMQNMDGTFPQPHGECE